MEDRRKQHKWHRCKKTGTVELSCLPGLERGPGASGSHNGKKGFVTDPVMSRLLPGPLESEGGLKQPRGRRAGVELSKMVSLMGGAGRSQLGAMGPLSLHNPFQPGPAPGSSLPYMPFPTASSSGSLLHPGLGHGSYPTGPHMHLGSLGHPQPDEEEEDEDEIDDLSQGYASSEQDFSLLDDPMMPANSDSSDGANDGGD
ncbi:50S ribosomal protein L3 [Platysternon megacephalum]|uniref:50S ribosomal protein L3 n=1 Tax=Platysternon megacephalum TaxID=55544 RepID=A0A4D9DGP7_9SAUR|nr:50S ribosomal protein L3 [Platysternon megacephalum]